MPPVLTLHEQRTLGCLLEKAVLTPEAYPLTLNSLHLACNQKTSREPVLELSEADVSAALNSLKGKDLVAARMDARATKYAHKVESAAALTNGQRAVITLLLIRGPQTAGELRGRSERMHEFGTPAEVEEALESLSAYAGGPWVRRLERRAGEKEARWAHTLDGGVAPEEIEAADADDRWADLERRIRALETEVAALKTNPDRRDA